MIVTESLARPYRQGNYDLCGIAAYATAVRRFCGQGLDDFLHDIWELDPVTVEPTDEATRRDFYRVYAPRLFGAFEWNGNGVKMFEWLRSLQEGHQGPSFRQADLACSLQTYPLARFDALERQVVDGPVIACIAIAFDAPSGPACHVVNVWCDAQAFHLRDSAGTGGEMSDGEAVSFIQSVELTGFRQWPNGHITGGMAVSSKFG